MFWFLFIGVLVTACVLNPNFSIKDEHLRWQPIDWIKGAAAIFAYIFVCMNIAYLIYLLFCLLEKWAF